MLARLKLVLFVTLSACCLLCLFPPVVSTAYDGSFSTGGMEPVWSARPLNFRLDWAELAGRLAACLFAGASCAAGVWLTSGRAAAGTPAAAPRSPSAS